MKASVPHLYIHPYGSKHHIIWISVIIHPVVALSVHVFHHAWIFTLQSYRILFCWPDFVRNYLLVYENLFFKQYMLLKSRLRRFGLQFSPALTWFHHEGAAEKRFIIEGSSVDLHNLSVMMSEETQWCSAGIIISSHAQRESLVRHLRKTVPMAFQNCERHFCPHREHSIQAI